MPEYRNGTTPSSPDDLVIEGIEVIRQIRKLFRILPSEQALCLAEAYRDFATSEIRLVPVEVSDNTVLGADRVDRYRVSYPEELLNLAKTLTVEAKTEVSPEAHANVQSSST